MSKPTDIEVLAKIYEDFPLDSEQVRRLKNRLSDIVGIAQNGPPYGAADGTIDESTWKRAQRLLLSFEELYRAICFIENDGEPPIYDDDIPF